MWLGGLPPQTGIKWGSMTAVGQLLSSEKTLTSLGLTQMQSGFFPATVLHRKHTVEDILKSVCMKMSYAILFIYLFTIFYQ